MAGCCSPVVERRAADALKSSRTVASADFINYVPKLEAAKGTPSVQMVSAGADGTIDFPDGSVRNAPQIANATESSTMSPSIDPEMMGRG